MNEIDLLGFDGRYTIDREGNIYSYVWKKKRKLKPQKASQSSKGYFQVRLFNEQYKNGKLFYVHRLVYETFVGDIPKDKEMDHIDGDTSNNSVDNLQLLSRRDNVEKYTKKIHGPSLRTRRDEFIKLYEELGTYQKVQQTTGLSYQQIYRVIKDVIHTKCFKTGRYITKRYNPELNDEYTRTDRRRFNNKRKYKRDELGRFAL